MAKSKHPPGCNYTFIGEREGLKIEAATDALGPQVIVGGPKMRVHLLSPAQKSHRQAVKLGKKVLAKGFDLCKDWSNLREQTLESLMVDLFFAGVKR